MIENKKNNKIKGQITIFVALVFFVLFTVFGMTISMGMFIHDKINLQNSTDLASYYVATKQAEMLSAIAHSNYQIRQSWKLAAFRYRIFSNGTRTNAPYKHPAIDGTPFPTYGGQHDVDYAPAIEFVTGSGNRVPPRVCIGATHMFKELSGDNTCKTINFAVSYIANVPAYIGIGAVGNTNSTIDETNIAIGNSCSLTAYANWWFANTIVGAHKLEQRDRRAVIEALARNLALPIIPGGMKDLDGRDVYEGAEKTFRYNLSESNKERVDLINLTFTNSMEGLEPSAWLPPILVNAVLPFSLLDPSGGGCAERLHTHVDDASLQTIMNSSVAASSVALQAQLDPDGVIRYLGSIGSDADPLMNLSVGVEKNPWYMVYNKAVGRVASKPLFMMNVLGQEINIAAVSYAKPFGGRVGPWYQTQWSSTSPESDSGERVDPLLPRRVEAGDLGALTTAQLLDDVTLRPNYSRYPSDERGLTSMAAQVAYGPIVGDWGITSPAPADVETSLFHFSRATYSYNNSSLYNDPLAQNISSPTPWDSFVRRLEIAAIAPDAFDIYYYSIMPGFYDYFVSGKLQDWLQVPNNVQVRGDIGSYGGDGATEEMRRFDVADQLRIDNVVQAIDGPAYSRARNSPWQPVGAFSFLTSWISGTEVMDYGPADGSDIGERFASCVRPSSPDVPIPSECADGGRTGYSVKIISRKYLESEDHPIGGGGNTGAIRNLVPETNL